MLIMYQIKFYYLYYNMNTHIKLNNKNIGYYLVRSLDII